MTTFQVGDVVRADVTAQGLKKGGRYEVANVIERTTAFGTFVTYVLKGPRGANAVTNGHMLLTKV